MSKNGGQDWVTTDLKVADKDRASKICSAISGYQVQDGTDGFKGVRVATATGEKIVWRQDVSESC